MVCSVAYRYIKNNSDKASVHESRISLAIPARVRSEKRRRIIFTLISTFIQLYRNKHGVRGPFNTVQTVVVLFPSSLSSKLDRAQVTVTADRLRLRSCSRVTMKLLVFPLNSQFSWDIKRNDRCATHTYIEYNTSNCQCEYCWKTFFFQWTFSSIVYIHCTKTVSFGNSFSSKVTEENIRNLTDKDLISFYLVSGH